MRAARPHSLYYVPLAPTPPAHAKLATPLRKALLEQPHSGRQGIRSGRSRPAPRAHLRHNNCTCLHGYKTRRNATAVDSLRTAGPALLHPPLRNNIRRAAIHELRKGIAKELQGKQSGEEHKPVTEQWALFPAELQHTEQGRAALASGCAPFVAPRCGPRQLASGGRKSTDIACCRAHHEQQLANLHSAPQ